MVIYILLLFGVFFTSIIFHNVWHIFGIEFKEDRARTRSMHKRALIGLWFSIIGLIVLVYVGWSLKGDPFIVWAAIIFMVEYLVERIAFRQKHLGIEEPPILKNLLKLARIGYIVGFFVWYYI